MLHNFISIVLNHLKSIELSTILKILKVCNVVIINNNNNVVKVCKFKLHLKV